MAKILKGYRGQSNPEDPIKDITKTYVGTPGGGGGGTDPEEKEAEEMAKYKALVEKAETKGWSDRKRIRKGVDANPKDYLPTDKKAKFNLKGEWTGTRDKWGGGKGEEGGKGGVKKPHIYIEKTLIEPTKSPQGRPNPFYNMPLADRIKARFKGYGPKTEHWHEGFQADHRPGTPYQETPGKHGKLPTGKKKYKRKLRFGWK